MEDFEAMSGNGKIAAMISNVGEISAEFDLAFNCTEYIQSLSSRLLYLAPYESTTLSIDVLIFTVFYVN